MKRAILDCYKYACLSLVDFYEKFRKEYKFADLAGIDNGDFLLLLTQSFSTGKQLLYKAKLSERQNKHSETLYSEFEQAFCSFLQCYKLIHSKISIVHRVSKKAKWSRFWGRFGFFISLASLAIALWEIVMNHLS